MHESNILKIKTETEKIVYEILESSKKIDFALKDENIKTMENELLKLKNEEFIISMVGTMKAGKSTTINAIVGQEILPSRVEAMTTLPTLITHIKGKVEPVLKLNKSYTNTLNDLLRKVRNNSKYNKSYSKSEQSITNNKNFQFKEQILGNEKIKEALTIFNDLRRVSKDQIFDKFIELENIPRIEIEFKTLKDIVTKDNSKLSLLDTPGPNEYKQSAKLKETLKIQLENSSAVVFVVDYKSYESGDTNDIKQRISDIHEYLKSKNFYILANKFDASKNSDEEYEDTKKRIHTYFELKEDKIELKNIFPVSSEWAFQSYLVNELILKDKINKSLPNTKNFWKDFLGELWEEDIEDIERVKKICKIKYKNSYFQKVIDNIVKDVYENAMFRVLEKTMIVIDASKIITKMGDGFKVRLNSVNDTTNIEVLNNKIELLKKDIDKIKKVEEDFKNISENNFYLEFDGIEKSINNKLKSLDNIKEFPKKKFEYKEEAQKAVEEKIQNIEQLKNNITSEFINKGEEIVKKYIEEINSKLRGDFEKIIDDIKNQLGKEIRVYSPNLDKSSYNIVTFSYTDNLVKTIDKEGNIAAIARFLNFGKEWGKETIINEKEVDNVVNNFKNSIYNFIKNNKESNFKNIKNEISKSINILKESIQIYTKDMENIQKESKNEEFDLNIKVKKIEMELDYINGLEKRIETIKKEISKEK
ncbi:dynamin family protein [Aliarcobacter butzleri]|uniref:dynamin family protein n=1 Tax=Aliarcobacter butzleri TaxID=28197 RepID=UPI0021B1B5D8|nr:dynamin family protein [Aliarcobacter butzleri]MCT7627055.1 dynamin family protein [Aliarcobacter butzleri]